MKSKLFRYYIYGYLNLFLMEAQRFKGEYANSKTIKIKRFLIYLGIPERWMGVVNSFSFLIPFFEIPISLFLLVCRSVKSVIICAFTKTVAVTNSYIVVAPGIPFSRINKFNSSITGFPLDYLWIPYEGMNRSNYTLSIYQLIKVKDVIQSFGASVCLLFFLQKKYGKRDFLFRSYASLQFFMTGLFINKLDCSNRLVFYDLINRWAYLLSEDARHEKILIQHGSLSENDFFVKMSPPEVVHYLNNRQKKVVDSKLFKSEPLQSLYLPLLEFTGSSKLIRNGKKNVLIICCPKFFDIEKKIIDSISKSNEYNLYVKTHPGFKDISDYLELQNRYGFTLLEKADYPPVDVAISYDSTLAYQYEDVGVKVLRYNGKQFEVEYKILLNNQ